MALASLCLGSAAAAAGRSKAPPTRFDLDCNLHHIVKQKTRNAGRKHLRIDLDSGRWCEDLCEQVYTLKTGEDRVELTAPPPEMPPTTIQRQVSINRKSGRLLDERRIFMDDTLVSMDTWFGECKLARYTGVDRKLF
jgi:hypothetical protein